VSASQGFSAASFTQNAGSVATTFGGLLNLSGAFDFTGQALNVNFVGANVVGTTMDVTNAGLFTTANGANLTVGNEFVQDGAGLVQLGGNLASTNDGFSFSSGVTLNNGITMTTGLGSGDAILFSSTLDGAVAGTQSLGLTAGLGDITFTGAVGTTRLGAVTVVSGRNLTESAGFRATTLDLGGLTGTASFPGPGGTGILDLSTGLTVGGGAKNVSITGGTSTTPNTIAGLTTFDNTGTLTIGSTANDATLFVGGLTAILPTSGSGAGFVRTAGGAVILGDVTFTAASTVDTTNNGAVAAGANLTLANALGGQDIILIGGSSGTVDLAGSTVATLTVTADEIDFSGGADTITSTGAILLQGATAATTIGVGGGAGTLDINDTDLAAITGGNNTLTIGQATQSGAIVVGSSTFKNPVIIRAPSGSIQVTDDVTNAGKAVTLTGGNVSLTVAKSITTTAAVNSGMASGSVTITTTGTGTITLAGNLVTTGAANNPGAGSAGGAVSITSENGVIGLANITTDGGSGCGGEQHQPRHSQPQPLHHRGLQPRARFQRPRCPGRGANHGRAQC
jgi:hypothetical protein